MKKSIWLVATLVLIPSFVWAGANISSQGTGSMTYPGAGVGVSDGSAWATSATGTRYYLTVWGASNTPGALAALGSSGSLLKSAGAGANPAWTTETFAAPGTVNALLSSDGTNWVRLATSANVTTLLGSANYAAFLSSLGGASLTAPTFVTSVGLPATLASAAAVTYTLMDNQASAFSYGSTGAADILKIGTLDAGPGVTVTGFLTSTGAVTGNTLVSGVATGTAPLTVSSTTVVANLNASALGGATFAAPGAIGGGTPAAITGTTITGTSFVTAPSDGNNKITLANNTAISPTASAYEMYIDAAIWKVNQNGTESALTLSPLAGQVTFAGPSAPRTVTIADAAQTLLNSTATGVQTFLTTPSSANLIAAVTDETGTGALVFANTPTLVTPAIGAATGTSLIATGIVDGLTNITICTDGTENANPTGKMSHVIVNKHATAATALTVTMATPVAGMQLLVKNGQGAGGTNTGAITLVAGTTGSSVSGTFTAQDTAYGFFVVNFDVVGTGTNRYFTCLKNGINDVCCLGIGANDTEVKLWNGAAESDLVSYTIAGDTNYCVWIESSRSSVDNFCRVSIAEATGLTCTKPGSPTVTMTAGVNLQMDAFIMRVTQNITGVFDKVRIRATALGSTPD